MSAYRVATSLCLLMMARGVPEDSGLPTPAEVALLEEDSEETACGVELLQAKLDLQQVLAPQPGQLQEKLRDPEIIQPGDVPPTSVKFTFFPAADYPLARCMDGTQTGLYIRPATDASVSNRYMFFLSPGGACKDEAECAERFDMFYGTSNDFWRYYDFDKVPHMSSSRSNPFADWNLIIVPNCDGSGFTGQRTETLDSTWGNLFSGHHIMNAGIEYMSRNHGMNQSDSIVLFGGAGEAGVAIFSQLDHWQSLLPTATVLGAPIAAIIPDPGPRYEAPDAFVAKANLTEASLEDTIPRWDSYLDSRCLTDHSDHVALCYLPDVAYGYVQAPLFILQALTDWRYLKGLRGVESDMVSRPEVGVYLNEYSKNTSNFIMTVDKQRDGLFAPSCYMNDEFQLDQPLIDGWTPFAALHAWVMDRALPKQRSSSAEEFFLIDSCPGGDLWPGCGTECPERRVLNTTGYTHMDDVQ